MTTTDEESVGDDDDDDDDARSLQGGTRFRRTTRLP